MPDRPQPLRGEHAARHEACWCRAIMKKPIAARRAVQALDSRSPLDGNSLAVVGGGGATVTVTCYVEQFKIVGGKS